MVKRLGLLVRADRGGLGIQTRDMLAHLEPDAALVVSLGVAGRGPEADLGLPTITYQRADWRTMNAFLDQIDVLLSVETFYEPYLVIEAEKRGIERVLYANPELLNADDPAERADRYLYAARWEYDPPVSGKILAYPAPADTLEPAAAREPGPLRVVHVGAPAMLDREGRNVLLDAVAYIREPVAITIFGQRTEATWRNKAKHVTVEWRGPVETTGELYAGQDVMVLPRRYGCLSLPMLEAAAAGVPTITTALRPQAEWFAAWPDLLVAPGPANRYPMKGNRHPGIPVHDPDPVEVAAVIDRCADDLVHVHGLGLAVRSWALERSWATLRSTWDTELR